MEIFHVYNRGVDKRDVFLEDSDRVRFVHDLYEFNDTHRAQNNNHLFPKLDVGHPVWGGTRRKREPIVVIHAWCLMNNHFHLMLSEVSEGGLSLFMKKLGAGYSKYFNEKYERSGALWQGKFKRKLITTDTYFLWLPLYIHLNPLEIGQDLDNYRWSSHFDYAGKRNFPSIISKSLLSGMFAEHGGYHKAIQDGVEVQDLRAQISQAAID